MANTTIAAEIHQTFDVHRHFATQVALDCVLGHRAAQRFEFRLAQVTDFGIRTNASGFTNRERACADSVKEVNATKVFSSGR